MILSSRACLVSFKFLGEAGSVVQRPRLLDLKRALTMFPGHTTSKGYPVALAILFSLQWLIDGLSLQ